MFIFSLSFREHQAQNPNMKVANRLLFASKGLFTTWRDAWTMWKSLSWTWKNVKALAMLESLKSRSGNSWQGIFVLTIEKDWQMMKKWKKISPQLHADWHSESVPQVHWRLAEKVEHCRLWSKTLVGTTYYHLPWVVPPRISCMTRAVQRTKATARQVVGIIPCRMWRTIF